ncbi:hypothetical protein FQR65_LT15168 [Abscondita terminalis]|nr:hypothetical protein FQR65_LT15168 [Abscondita terminalis]
MQKNGITVFIQKEEPPPVDGFNLEDPANKAFWENKEYRNKIDNSLKPNQVKTEDYSAIFFAGGHGTMWDFADNVELAKITADIYENDGIVGAVCHGPAGLVNVKLNNGKYLVDGKKINAFTNEEETAIKESDDECWRKSDTVSNAKQLLNNARPYLANVKTTLGSNDEIYLGLSSRIASDAQGKCVSEINKLQEQFSRTYDNATITRQFFLLKRKSQTEAWEVSNTISAMDLRADFRTRTEQKKATEWPKVEQDLKDAVMSWEDYIEKIRNNSDDGDLNMESVNAHIQEYRTKIEYIIKEKNAKDAKELTREIGQLDFELPLTYHWKDATKARQLINQGLQMATNGRTSGIRQILVELISLMPENEKPKETLG